MHKSVTGLATYWGCKRQHVQRLITSGKLPAIDISEGSGRRTWRISEEAIKAFEAARGNTKPVEKPRRAKREPAGRFY